MCKWRPADVQGNADWSVKHQIVLPESFRTEVLSLAHENPFSGHLGVTKIDDKLLNHFFWPCMKNAWKMYENALYMAINVCQRDSIHGH